MTGFGSGRAKSKDAVITSEFKTVNHKFLEINCKLPNSLSTFDDKKKALLQNSLHRGKNTLNIFSGSIIVYHLIPNQ